LLGRREEKIDEYVNVQSKSRASKEGRIEKQRVPMAKKKKMDG